MDEIQKELLSLVILDYESVETIHNELVESLGYEPSSKEIKEALISLKGRELIAFYQFDEKIGHFKELEEMFEPIDNLWVMATTQGKEV